MPQPVDAPTAGRGSERADQALHSLVVRLERVLAEDRLALRVVQLQVDPVDAIVLALQVGLPDELAAQAGPRGLGRPVLGLLDGGIVGDAVDHVALGQAVVDTAVGADVVVLQVHEGDLGVAPRQSVPHHVALDPLPLYDPLPLPPPPPRVPLPLLPYTPPA